MTASLAVRKVAILASDDVEQSELVQPWTALEEVGAQVDLISIDSGEIQAKEHDQTGKKFPVDAVLGNAKASDYDALVLPGGSTNANRLRQNAQAVKFVKEF